ncbi:hypothetical protein BC826DRAFT_971249 [Russula brevipes]|nr:hypothetical protein BC826DRAFT_971249 [Russula brevipes]
MQLRPPYRKVKKARRGGDSGVHKWGVRSMSVRLSIRKRRIRADLIDVVINSYYAFIPVVCISPSAEERVVCVKNLRPRTGRSNSAIRATQLQGDEHAVPLPPRIRRLVVGNSKGFKLEVARHCVARCGRTALWSSGTRETKPAVKPVEEWRGDGCA